LVLDDEVLALDVPSWCKPAHSASMRFANAEDGRSPRNPILAGFGPFCPQAMPRHKTAAPPRSVRTSLRRMEQPRVRGALRVCAGSLGIKELWGIRAARPGRFGTVDMR
jgi:hypothetical protein